MSPDELEPVISVSEFVALLNQTFEYAFPSVTISGELANLRVSKGKWLYFDLKDDSSSVKFFGTVYQLPGPLEDGMLLKVRGVPRLHNQYGFSVTVQNIQPTGEGAIRRAAELLKAKLVAEGLFDEARKRSIPYPPKRIGLITSAQSAAYADFMKILAARWQGVSIELIDVQVQGEIAVGQIIDAVEQFNSSAEPPEVLVIIRGGGSADDMAVFNTEQVTRSIAASRIPTLVAIGHEIDVCLAELAADRRASTPSNAAELLVPDRADIYQALETYLEQFHHLVNTKIKSTAGELDRNDELMTEYMRLRFRGEHERLEASTKLLNAFDPETILRRGYAIVRSGSHTVRRGSDLQQGALVRIQLVDAQFDAAVKTIIIDKAQGVS
jgi:exodeoxyribonuclease VII large subunit